MAIPPLYFSAENALELIESCNFKFMETVDALNLVKSQRKGDLLVYRGGLYHRNKKIKGREYWQCRSGHSVPPCKARLTTTALPGGRFLIAYSNIEHNHREQTKLDMLLKTARKTGRCR